MKLILTQLRWEILVDGTRGSGRGQEERMDLIIWRQKHRVVDEGDVKRGKWASSLSKWVKFKIFTETETSEKKYTGEGQEFSVRCLWKILEMSKSDKSGLGWRDIFKNRHSTEALKPWEWKNKSKENVKWKKEPRSKFSGISS